MSRVGRRVEQLHGSADPMTGAIDVTGILPGPAGLATLPLLGGRAELAVDVADPDQLVSLQFDDIGNDAARRLASIILGPEAAARLDRLGPESEVIWEPRRGWSQRDGLALIGRLGLALGELTRADLPDRAVAVGLVEAGVLAVDLGVDLAPHPDGPTLIGAGLDRWEALDSYAFADLHPDTIAFAIRNSGHWRKAVLAADPVALFPRLERLLDVLERLGRRTGRIRSPIKHGGDRAELWLADAVDAMPTAAPAAASASAERRAKAGAPGRRHDVPVVFHPLLAASEPRVIAAELDAHHLTVHVGGLPDGDGDVSEGKHTGGTWLRVFTDRRRPTLVAMVPFPPSDRPWRTAVALIPAGLQADALLVDITTKPDEPWRSPATQAVRTATHLGGAAARSSRMDHWSAPADWEATSAAWSALGDDGRATLAAEYSSAPPPAEPLATDVLNSGDL